MTMLRNPVFGLLLLASPALAMTDLECEKEWRFADINHNGIMSEDEAEIYFHDRTMLGYGGIAQPDFMRECRNGTLGKSTHGRIGQQTPVLETQAAVPTDAGVPLQGLNVLTASQAEMRIAEAGYTNISGLARDESGEWRAIARKNGGRVSVALDFKGNVVSH